MMTDKPIETKTKKMKVECQSCNHKYSEDKINIHISETHETMKCDSCEYKCAGTIMLLRHQRMDHGAASKGASMDDLYDLEIVYRVKIKKWRIDDQSILDNWEWSLCVYDKVQKKWVQTADLDRPGEEAGIESVTEL